MGRVGPSKLLSIEYMVYYAAAVLWFYTLFRAFLSVSDRCLASSNCREYLQEGWIEGRMIDLSDHQWHSLRENLPFLIAGMAVYVPISRCVRRFGGSHHIHLRFLFVVSLGFIFLLNGYYCIFYLTFALLNFIMIRLLGTRRLFDVSLGVLWSWSFGIGLILIKEYHHKLPWLRATFDDNQLLKSMFDGWFTGLSHWAPFLNLAMLRIHSYNSDYMWALYNKGENGKEWVKKHMQACQDCISLNSGGGGGEERCYKVRERAHLDVKGGDYGFTAYFTYLFYLPLFIAGPITPFNAWMSQMIKAPTNNPYTSTKGVAIYLLRWVGCLLGFEWVSHYMYPYALGRAKEYTSLNAIEMVAYVNVVLLFLWLKFTIIWRFFRLWALLDGIEVVENMNRCIFNTHSVAQFWKRWHRGFNRWLVRYVYVPLGGTSHRFRNVWVVFLFVAAWHDFEPKLLAWAAFFGVWFAIEGVTANTVGRRLESRPLLRSYLVSASQTFVMFFGYIINWVGFGPGVESIPALVGAYNADGGWWVLAWQFFSGFCVIQIQHEVLRDEVRRNVAKDY